MLIGYIRVSKMTRTPGLQRNALECAGCEQIFEDKMSGKTTQRPGLKRALKKLKPGDTDGLETGQAGAQYAPPCCADR